MTRLTTKWASLVLSGFAQPTAAGLTVMPNEVDYATTFRRLLRGSTRLAALGLLLGLGLAVLAPLWKWGRFTTFAGLSPVDRATLLGELLRHPWFAVRELTLLLKLAAALALLGTPSVRARSGYDNVQPAARIESGLKRALPVLVANDNVREKERSAS